MITVITEECNEISQEFYDDAMDSIQTCQLECSCGHCGCLVGHGTYTRSIKTARGKIPLAIRRVQCSLCNATHALLPSGIVPCSQVLLTDHAAIASSFEDGRDGREVMDTNPELSPSQVFYILSLYIRFWRQRLLSESLPLFPAHALTKPVIDASSFFPLPIIAEKGRCINQKRSSLDTVPPTAIASSSPHPGRAHGFPPGFPPFQESPFIPIPIYSVESYISI